MLPSLTCPHVSLAVPHTRHMGLSNLYSVRLLMKILASSDKYCWRTTTASPRRQGAVGVLCFLDKLSGFVSRVELESFDTSAQGGAYHTPGDVVPASLSHLPAARVKRILANRESAARSKQRKLDYMMELENQVTMASHNPNFNPQPIPGPYGDPPISQQLPSCALAARTCPEVPWCSSAAKHYAWALLHRPTESLFTILADKRGCNGPSPPVLEIDWRHRHDAIRVSC